MKAMRSVYNFFRMFHKDSGAHFTYNQGVGLMRWGALCIAGALAITAVYLLWDGSRITKRDIVSVEVISCSRMTDGSPTMDGEVVFAVISGDGKGRRRVTQKCSFFASRRYEKYRADGRQIVLNRYSVKGREDYITESPWIVLPYEYHMLYPSFPAPVPVWLVPILIAAAVLLFIMGSKQIGISMKYARSDVEFSEHEQNAGALGGGEDDILTYEEFLEQYENDR